MTAATKRKPAPAARAADDSGWRAEARDALIHLDGLLLGMRRVIEASAENARFAEPIDEARDAVLVVLRRPGDFSRTEFADVLQVARTLVGEAQAAVPADEWAWRALAREAHQIIEANTPCAPGTVAGATSFSDATTFWAAPPGASGDDVSQVPTGAESAVAECIDGADADTNARSQHDIADRRRKLAFEANWQISRTAAGMKCLLQRSSDDDAQMYCSMLSRIALLTEIIFHAARLDGDDGTGWGDRDDIRVLECAFNGQMS